MWETHTWLALIHTIWGWQEMCLQCWQLFSKGRSHWKTDIQAPADIIYVSEFTYQSISYAALSGRTATQCIENTVFIRRSRLDMTEQNWIGCMGLSPIINSFPINSQRKIFSSSVWSNNAARPWTVTKSSEQLNDIFGKLNRENQQKEQKRFWQSCVNLWLIK